MMRKMAVLTALVAILAFAPGAMADSVGSTSCSTGQPVTLGNDNIANLTVIVTLCVDGANVTLAGVSWTGGVAALTFSGVDTLQYQQNVTLVSAAPPGNAGNLWSPTIAASGGPSGFGSFSFEINANLQSSPLSGYPGQLWTFSGNQSTSGLDYMAHVRLGNGCSAWVSGRSYTATESTDTNCTGTSVPEPGTMSLFGLGLLGIAIRRFIR